MSRAVVTHFDGDPFLLNFWLLLYEKYWRGECDKVYMSVFYNPKVVPEEAVAFNRELLAKFPEIKIYWLDSWDIPERANQTLLKEVTEDQIGLIESDGFIYGKGVVDQCFRLLDQGQDIVAPPWILINDPYISGDLTTKGFMRCFFFTKKSVLDQIDIDFMPRTIPANTKLADNYSTDKPQDLDCFGWICWQLALLRLKVTLTPNNVLGPDEIMKPYSNFKWVHVRQMSSSALGMGGGEYGMWADNNSKNIVEKVFSIFNEDFPDGPAEYTYVKAVAFRFLFWSIMENKEVLGEFSNQYRQVLDMVIDYYNMPREKIAEIKGFYKGLFEI